MILVNLNKKGSQAVTPEQIREAAAAAWVLSAKSEQEFGDYLVAVYKNRVIGAWAIEGVDRITEGPDQGRAVFSLADAPALADMIGQESPVVWTKGAANPVKLVDTSTLRQEAADIELTPQGNRRIQLDGWTLITYGDGRARVSPPGGARIVVESAFPGPSGANVTVRIDDAFTGAGA